jgi:hypothetical protein
MRAAHAPAVRAGGHGAPVPALEQNYEDIDALIAALFRLKRLGA